MMKFPAISPTLILMILMILIIFFIAHTLSPVIILMILTIYTSLICLNLSMWTKNYLYSIMLFLIMISGMLIIFLYFSSTISNEQMKMAPNMIFVLLSISIILPYLTHPTEMAMPLTNFTADSAHLYNFNNNTNDNIVFMYNYPYNNLTLLCMFYLLFTLLMIIKICTHTSKPLRKMK